MSQEAASAGEIFVVDDDPAVRDVLTTVFSRDGFQVANFADGASLLASATMRTPELMRPWTKSSPRDASGTGVVIEGKRILTNAHVVTYASQLFVESYQSSDKLVATVESHTDDYFVDVTEHMGSADRAVDVDLLATTLDLWCVLACVCEGMQDEPLDARRFGHGKRAGADGTGGLTEHEHRALAGQAFDDRQGSLEIIHAGLNARVAARSRGEAVALVIHCPHVVAKAREVIHGRVTGASRHGEIVAAAARERGAVYQEQHGPRRLRCRDRAAR